MSKNEISEREIFFRHLALTSFEPPAVQFVSARGIYLYDVHGNSYTDLSAGFSVNNLGYGQTEIIEAIKAQAERYLHQTVYGEFVQSPQVQLAKRLIELLPESLDCVYLVNSGAEAIEGAIKLAKRVTGRPLIVSFRNAYHGSTHGALSLMGNETLKIKYRPLLPGIVQLNFNDFDDLKRITEQVACVVVEPVQAEAGVILPQNGYLEALRKRCDETGALLVFDEIQTGFGRIAHLFAFEKYGIVPDILCLAKALGAGLPLGAIISSKKNLDMFAYNPPLGHLTTFGGNPVSCAAAIAGLNILVREKLWDKTNVIAQKLTQGLAEFEIVKQIRTAGLLIGIQFKSATIAEAILSQLWHHRLISDRFLFAPDALRISPPLIINEEEAGIINQQLKQIFLKIQYNEFMD